MSLKDTVHKMKQFLHEIASDLEKAAEGNRAASQRVRTKSIAFAKAAKMYRKESVAAERKGGGAKAAKKAPAKKAAKKTAKRKKK